MLSPIPCVSRSVQLHARDSVFSGGNVDCRTFHSLAYQDVGYVQMLGVHGCGVCTDVGCGVLVYTRVGCLLISSSLIGQMIALFLI